MNPNIIRNNIHIADFTNSCIVTGFLHDITGLQLDTGNSQEAKILVNHLFREYNRKCQDTTNSSLQVTPMGGDFRPTLVAAASASVPFVTVAADAIIQFDGDSLLLFDGDQLLLF